MKLITFLFLALFLLCFPFAQTFAQRSKTIILVRHAETDTSDVADQNDPGLSPTGTARAERLLKKIKKYRPGAVYSTNYRRTRLTVEPIAKHRKIEIQAYDPREPAQLVDQILKSKTKRFIVSGHSNTIPGLANLLIKKEIFKPLDESEYGTIWIIKLRQRREPEVRLLSY